MKKLSTISVYSLLFAAIVLAILCLVPFQSVINSATVALILLLVILIIASFFGSRPALLASIIGVLGFNFFFLPPLYTLTLNTGQKVMDV